MEIGGLAFFITAIFGSMAHVSFLVLHVTTLWCVVDLMKREVAAAAAVRRTQTMQLTYAGPPMPTTR